MMIQSKFFIYNYAENHQLMYLMQKQCPVAVVEIPHRIPPGFHAFFVIEVSVTSIALWIMLGSKDLGFYVFRTLCVLLANHDQNNVFRSVLVLLKVMHLCKVGIKLMQKIFMHFGLARSIEARAECFFCRFSNSALVVLKRFRVF